MATDYFALRGLDSQIKLLTATVADLEHQLDLTQRRFAGGVATAVDVAQAQTQLETVRAQLVDVGVARAQFEHAIGTIANYNLSSFSIPPSPLDLSLPKVPVGVPSQLLERRPDIAAAERLAAAANAQIGIAVSAFYPTITLGGTGGFESTNPGTWIQGPSSLWSLGAQASGAALRRRPAPRPHRPGRHSYEAQAAATATPSSRPSTTSKTSSPASEFSSRNRAPSSAPSPPRSTPSICPTSATKAASPAILKSSPPSRPCSRTSAPPSTSKRRQFAASVGLVRALGGGWDVRSCRNS